MMVGNNPGAKETAKRIRKNTVGAELGVWRGESSSLFVEKTKHLHLVDTWSVEPYKEYSKEMQERYVNRYRKLVGSEREEDFQKYYDNVYNDVKNKFKNLPVTVYRMSTNEWFKTFKEKLDWIYVDARHDYDGVLEDLRNCLNVLHDTGVIYGDDYGNKPGVKEAVDQFVKENDLHFNFNNFWGDQFEIFL